MHSYEVELNKKMPVISQWKPAKSDSQQCDDHNDNDCQLTPIAEPKFCISELGWWSEAQHCDLLIVRKATLKSMHNVSWNYFNLSEHIHTYPNLYEPIRSYPNLSEPIQTYPNLFVLIWTYSKISKSIYKVSKTRISETRMENVSKLTAQIKCQRWLQILKEL